MSPSIKLAYAGSATMVGAYTARTAPFGTLANRTTAVGSLKVVMYLSLYLYCTSIVCTLWVGSLLPQNFVCDFKHYPIPDVAPLLP